MLVVLAIFAVPTVLVVLSVLVVFVLLDLLEGAWALAVFAVLALLSVLVVLLCSCLHLSWRSGLRYEDCCAPLHFPFQAQVVASNDLSGLVGTQRPRARFPCASASQAAL